MEQFDKIKFKPVKVGFMKANQDLMALAMRLPRTYADNMAVLPFLYEAADSENPEADVDGLDGTEIVPAVVAALAASGFVFGSGPKSEDSGEVVPA